MPVQDLPIFCYYDKQRFTQAGPMDCANWYGVRIGNAKKEQALYPAMGRAHVSFLGLNRLVFDDVPRHIYKSIDYFYVIIGSRVFQYDSFFNQKLIGTVSLNGDIWFATLPVNTTIINMMTDGNFIYLITESGTSVTMETVTDGNAPINPGYVASFGNRFVVSQLNTPDFWLSTIGTNGGPSACFTYGVTPNTYALQNRATGIIKQFGVLHNQLYIFNDFTTDVWSLIPTQITIGTALVTFPWKLNTSYNWDFGIADPHSLDIDFGMMTWLAKNKNGLVTFVSSDGQQPKPISTQAINVLLENSFNNAGLSPFIINTAVGFLYQYENSIFYRVSAMQAVDVNNVVQDTENNSLEYNFDTQTWHRCVELDGSKNKILDHIFFNGQHLVTVEGDTAMYEMAGNIYYNEFRTPNTSAQAPNAFTKYPMRYELITPQIFQEGYIEFITDYVEIDFVFGNQTFYQSTAPFLNTKFMIDENPDGAGNPVYIVGEQPDSQGSPVFVIQEGTNTPTFDDNHYNALFKPHVELYYSDDGGMTVNSADVLQFSDLGNYRWRMRWYNLGASRNRVYRLFCVSSAPIVILGAVQNIRRSSGGAN